jgi:hypothetical protein
MLPTSAPRKRYIDWSSSPTGEHAPVGAGEQLDPLVLELVGVLELVDQDVLEAALVVLQQVQVAREHLERAQQQLGEVHHALAIALRVVVRVELHRGGA